MKYIVYIHVYVLHILNQQSSVKISLAIQKRKLLKQLALINMAFTKYGIIFIYMYLKKKFDHHTFLSRTGRGYESALKYRCYDKSLFKYIFG